MPFMFLLTEAPAAAEEALSPASSIIGLILYLAFFGGAIYFIAFRPQKKREIKLQEMVNKLIVGDKVTTIGGITGKVVNIKDDEITIETSIEKSKIQFKKWAVRDVDKPVES